LCGSSSTVRRPSAAWRRSCSTTGFLSSLARAGEKAWPSATRTLTVRTLPFDPAKPGQRWLRRGNTSRRLVDR
jgi:hypothetical protein